MTAKRITPMLLAEDVDASAAYYTRLGFTSRETEDKECLGLVSNDGTGIILLGDRYARSSMPTKAVDMLADKGGFYVWVDDLAEVRHDEEILGEVQTDYGTHERFVKQNGRLIVYAQKSAT